MMTFAKQGVCALLLGFVVTVGVGAGSAQALLLITYSATVDADPMTGPGTESDLYLANGGVFAAGDTITGTFSYTTNGVSGTPDLSDPSLFARYFGGVSASASVTSAPPFVIPTISTVDFTNLCDRDAATACIAAIPPGEDFISLVAIAPTLPIPPVGGHGFVGLVLVASDVDLLTGGTGLPTDTLVKSYFASAGTTGMNIFFAGGLFLPTTGLSLSFSSVVTPEPGSIALMGAGVLGLVAARRRRKRAA